MFYLDTRVALIGKPATEYDFPGNEGTYGAWLIPVDQAAGLLAGSPPALILVRDRFLKQFQEACGHHATEVDRDVEYTIFRSVPATDTPDALGSAAER